MVGRMTLEELKFIIGLDYGMQPRSPGLLARTSAVILAAFEKSRMDPVSTGRHLSSSCCQTKFAPLIRARREEL
jgi:hypothetical protein